MVITSVADIRTKPSTNSERDSQLVYGETVEILEEVGEFAKVRGKDGVVGYMKRSLLGNESERVYKLSKQHRNRIMALSFGSLISEDDVTRFMIPERYLVTLDKHFSPVKLARRFMGVPYLWGGTSDFGFDCSGFTQRLFRFSGIEIPRNSNEQRDASITVKDFDSSLPGDLIFFKGHVAIYMGRGKIIHANGHYSRVTENDLFDGSDYSLSLMRIFEKIGRFPE